MADGRVRDGGLVAVAEAPSVRHLVIAVLVAVIAMWMIACSSETSPTMVETAPDTATANPTVVPTSTVAPTETVPAWEFGESTDLFTEQTSSMAYLPADNIQGFEPDIDANDPGIIVGCGSEDSFFVGLHFGTYVGSIGELLQVRYRRDRQSTPAERQWYSGEIGVLSDEPYFFAQLLATTTTHLLIQSRTYRDEWYTLEFTDVRGITDALAQLDCYPPY